jgi:hypothetical protein
MAGSVGSRCGGPARCFRLPDRRCAMRAGRRCRTRLSSNGCGRCRRNVRATASAHSHLSGSRRVPDEPGPSAVADGRAASAAQRPRRRVAAARPRRPNQVRSYYDFVFDRCANGQQLKCLTVTDEFTKEGLAIDVDGRIRSPRMIEVLRDWRASAAHQPSRAATTVRSSCPRRCCLGLSRKGSAPH